MLDVEFYKNAYADLAEMSDQQLINHYETHGYSEGRHAASLAVRENLIAAASEEKTILEIGPFGKPVVTGKNVAYFDVLDAKALIERAKALNYQIESVPEIDWVSPDGDLSVVKKSYHAVISSHAIEHQPDLIRHLQQVAKILKPGGAYYLMIPDKRFCFDHFLAESTIADLMQAHREERRRHTLASVIEHRALTTHNDAAAHWRGEHGEQRSGTALAEAVQAAIDEFDAAGGGYIDVHAWKFTPRSFVDLVTALHAMDLSPLVVESVLGTPRDRVEFTAILRKADTSRASLPGRKSDISLN